MKNKKFLLFFIMCLFFYLNFSISQDYSGFYPNDANMCGTVKSENEPLIPSEFRGGYYKPHRSDINSPPGQDYFPILIVFIQFQGEPDVEGYGWHTGPQGPDWIDSVITPNRAPDNTDWWNSYNQFQVSDYWHEFSRGRLHVIGQAIPITLPYTEQQYLDLYNQNFQDARKRVYKDVYDALIALNEQIYWPFYDRWSYTNGDFQWAPDTHFDMIYLIFRMDPLELIKAESWLGDDYAEGFMPQGRAQNEDNYGNYLVHQNGSQNIYITSWINGNWYLTSGLVVNGRGGPANRDMYMEVVTHEHGHYFFGGGHIKYGKMAFGPGREFSFSPWESIKMGYIQPKKVTFGQEYYTLKDITSRDGHAGDEGEILQVPISTNDEHEFFLIANRRKLSEWDRRMSGDTVPEPKWFLKNINPEYGKGIYIYHYSNGYNYVWGNFHDLECADGLWNWAFGGYGRPDWGQNTLHPAYRRETISRLNDKSLHGSSLNNRDGLSFYSDMASWYSIGKSHTYYPNKTHGTDKIYTNTRDWWYSLENCGDRWDAWNTGNNIGCNEVFSPYSNPNTKNWNDNQTGIFIWYHTLTSNQEAVLDIYKAGDGLTEYDILALLPPSKPVGIKMEEYYPEGANYCHPKITWLHNEEPNMNNNGELYYQVWRAKTTSMDVVPYEYTQIEIVHYPINESPYFTDLTLRKFDCELWDGLHPGIPYPVRYYVVAINADSKVSVPSDFVSTEWTLPLHGRDPGEGDNPIINNLIPKEYLFYQNYPNPFNPVTTIEYSIPKNEFVNMKIYDVTGREIMILVNENKQAGYYSVLFDGSNLASGIYFYRLVAGNYVAAKRMVLIK